MTENQESSDSNQQQNIQFHVPQELDYVYRDFFNVFVGTGDVVIEFGNQHRSMPEHVSISNRIVLSLTNAYNLQQTLQKVLHEAQMQMQNSFKESDKH